MRIVHIACVAPPETGGIGQAAYREVQGLVARGHEAVLLAPMVDSIQADPLVKRLSTWWRIGNASSLRGIRAAIKTADLVHVHYPYFGAIEQVLLACRKEKKPVVLTFHMDATTKEWRGSLFFVHRFFMQDFVFGAAKRVLVSSLDYALHSSAAHWVKSHPARVVEAPFGIDTQFFVPPASKPVHDKVTLLMVGGLDAAHRFKGLPELLQAMVKLPTNVALRVVGDGHDKAWYEAEAKRLGVAKRVEFTGRLTTEDLRSAFQAADLFVFPSTSQAEAFGLVAVEAQACGVPVIASDLPGVRTVVKQGETGILVPPRDVDALRKAILQAVKDPAWRSEAGQRARQRTVDLFDQERHLDRLLEVYQACLKV